MTKELFHTLLAKLLIKAEKISEEKECEERYMQDIPPKGKTQNQSETKYKFVEITLIETE